MFKHKSLAIAAAVAVGLSFAGQGAQAQTAAPTANSNATVINFFHTIPPDTEAYVKSTLLPPFQTANPDCVVNLRNLGIEGGDTLALTNTALSAKDDSSPSLYWDASSSTGAFAKAGVLADVQGFFDKNPALKSNVIDSLLTLSTYGGKIQSIPMTTNNVAVYVNVTAFKAAGVIVPSQDPTKTWTWDEFRADAKTISDFGKMKGLLFSDGGGWASWLATGWLGQAGTTFINPDGTVGFNSPEALKAYTYLQGFVADKSIAFSEPGKGWDPAP